MADRFTYDVFLSHNLKDKRRVRRMAEDLRAAGLRVAIEHGLEAARAQVLCLSPAALESDWVALERSTVLFRNPSNTGRRFIPLLLADCELPNALRRYKYLDYRRKTKSAFAELLAACRSEMESAPPAPKDETARKPAQPPEQTEPLAVLERKLRGHEGWVMGVAVSPDGTWAASGSRDETVKIWDLETGTCWATLRGHTDDVNSVAITPDGKRILSASDDGSVRVWDASSGKKLAQLSGHTAAVLTVVALLDNTRALSGGYDKTLRLWELATGTCLKIIETREDFDVIIAQPSIRRGLGCYRALPMGEFGCVVVFNCGFAPAEGVVCTAYVGLPDTSQTLLSPPRAATIIGTSIPMSPEGLERATASIPWGNATANQAITVTVEMSGQLMDIGWVGFPLSASSSLLAGS
jgi:hypothetical protein